MTLLEIDMISQENALAAKLSEAKISKEELERRLAAADHQIADAALSFADWAGADVAEALAALEKLQGGGDSEESTSHIFRVAHDLKGQGTTFGYPLATQIGGLLCEFLKATTPSPSGESVSVIRAHLDALNLVVKQKIKGDGDAMAQQLIVKLTLAAARVKQNGGP
jgi:chemotaxis protein histidine kinase CheA